MSSTKRDLSVLVCFVLILSGALATTETPTWKDAEYIGGEYRSSFGYKFGPGGLLKSNFHVEREGVASATVYVAANGVAEVYVDGKRAGGAGSGRRVLEPVLSQFEKRMFYVASDVKDLLDSSPEHTLGVVLGRGHWSHYQYGEAGAMVQLVVDGKSVLTTKSDGSWLSHRGPILEDDLFNGEVFDGRIAHSLNWTESIAGWALHTAQNDGWSPIRSSSTTFFRPPLLTEQDESIPPTVASVPSISRNITWLSKDTCVIDFGENGAGWSRLEIRNRIPLREGHAKESASCAGTQIRLAHAEMVNPQDGDLFNQYKCPVPSRVCVNQTDHYTCSGARATEIYEPRFTWHGYRYVKVEGCLTVIMPGGSLSKHEDTLGQPWACELFAIRVGTNFSSSSLTFPSSPILTSVSAMIERTMLSNQIGYQTSCPQREKVAWTADSLATARTLLLMFGTEAVPYLRNYVRSLSDNFDLSYISNAPNGTIDDTVPHVQFQLHTTNMTDGTSTFPSQNGSSPGDNGGWTPVFPLTVQLLYETDGDAAFVRQYYSRLKAFTSKMMDMCGSVPPPAILSGHSRCGFYGDWSNPIPQDTESRILIEGRIISTSYTILQLDAMGELAKAVGNTEDHSVYAALADKQRALFDAFYWNESLLEYGTNHTFVQLSSIMALRVLYGKSPHPQLAGTAKRIFVANATRAELTKSALVGDIRARGGRHTVGLIGWQHLFHVLTSIDEHELAVDLLESQEFPSLGYMLRQQGEGSTLWERWNEPDSTNPTVSLNHPMFGSVYEWLVEHKKKIDRTLQRRRQQELVHGQLRNTLKSD